MRAVQFGSFGDAAVLEIVDLPDPEPGPGQVQIAVAHAGVNFAEVMFRRGQFPVGLPHIPGLEAAGRITAVGEGVTELGVGQLVAALTLAGGGNAERVLAPADLVVPLEGSLAELGTALAAAALCNVTTAWGILTSAARFRDGESIAIFAAAGGVGSAAAQLARSLGASHVFGAVSSEAKIEAAKIHYDAVVTYEALAATVDELTGGAGVDVLLDSVGGKPRAAATGLLAPFGRHVIFGDAAQEDATYDGNDVWFSNTSRAGYNLGGLAGSRPALLRSHLAHALQAVADGVVTIDVTELPLDEVRRAHSELESRSSTGKYVLRAG